VTRRSEERGAALLSVLLLVAVMAVIAAVMLERLNLATRLASNGQAMTQARLIATSAESVAMARIKALVDADPARTVDRAGLLGRSMSIPVGNGSVEIRIEDAGNCFNVNSLVEQGSDGRLTQRPAALAQFRALMESLGIGAGEAIAASDALADWIDSDDASAPSGAEDASYAGLPVPYRTAGRLVADVSELRAVKGITPQTYERLRPWLCALPAAVLSPININTLRPDQARLLTMLAPGALPLDRARALIAARPPQGFADTAALAGLPLAQVQVRSRWFLIDQAVSIDRIRLEEEALVDVALSPPRVAFRTWGGKDSR
jgi:general secretion pathway protein K